MKREKEKVVLIKILYTYDREGNEDFRTYKLQRLQGY